MPPASDSPEEHGRGRHVASALHVHLVIVTKHRRGVPGADMPSCCLDAMRKACDDVGAELREFTGEDDHVHLLVGSRPRWPSPPW
jgi:REP-associated tyrosine transposase